MKTTKMMILGALIGTCTFAAAQEEKPARPEGGGRGMRQPSPEMLKEFDKDGDGKLSDQEKLMAQAAWQRLRGRSSGPVYGPGYGFPQANANAGGIAAANAAAAGNGGGEGKAKVSALVKRFDKDGDGKLNDEEKATAQAELKKDKKAKADKPEADKPVAEKP